MRVAFRPPPALCASANARAQEEALQSEVHIQSLLAGQPHVVQLLGVFSDDLGAKTMLVLELCDGGDMLEALHKFRIGERDVAHVLRCVLDALRCESLVRRSIDQPCGALTRSNPTASCTARASRTAT